MNFALPALHSGLAKLKLRIKTDTMHSIPDKLLFTPGPLTTSKTIKEAMLKDLGSRDTEFIGDVSYIRKKLLSVANVSKEAGYECVIMQGSGTFGIEAVVSSAIPIDGHLLILVNGVYGERMAKMASIHHIPHSSLVFNENEIPDPELLRKTLSENKLITHVAIVHCETTTGIINPIESIGRICAEHGKKYIVDAMSSFGAYPINLPGSHIHFLVSSSNKCIEGVPGFSFIIANKTSLAECENRARTLSLDLFAQWKGLESDGQFRFTPPVHVLLAFVQALKELEDEGGVKGRSQRYKKNYETLSEGMKTLGFKEYLEPQNRGYIITCFHYPQHPDFNFKEFYTALSDKGFVIYPGKLSKVDCFRIGNIGRITHTDISNLLKAIKEILEAKGIQMQGIGELASAGSK